MFLLSPQYWLFEALAVFLVAWVIFAWFNRTNGGRRVARAVTLQNRPEDVAADAEELAERAVDALGEAERELSEAHRTTKCLRELAGVPDNQEGVSTK